MNHHATNDDSRHTMPDNIFEDSDLDDLLEESTDLLAGTPAPIAQKTQEIFSLDDLLSESMAIVSQREQMKQIRKAAANGFGSKEERDTNNDLLRKWEAAREWHKKANVAAFTRCTCLRCKTYNVVFAGFYERQTHRSNATIERLIKVDKHTDTFQKEVRYFDEKLAVCEDCLAFDGYPVEGLEEITVEGDQQ